MPEELKTYLRLDRLSLRHRFYAHLDSQDYQADGLFINHKVRVKFLQEYAKDGFSYRIIFCRIRKRDESSFLEGLRALPDKMLICGYHDYPAQCKQLMTKIEATKKEGFRINGSNCTDEKAKQT